MPIQPAPYDEHLRALLPGLRAPADALSPVVLGTVDASPSPLLDATATALAQQRTRDDLLTALARRVAHMAAAGGGVSVRDLERYLGRNDLLRINYLERGLHATRSVCRIRVANQFGNGGDWGTGFLVAPQLLLTNHHVLPSAEAALRTIVEFGYEADVQGRLQQGVRFAPAPERAFLTDPELDWTLVALAARSEDGTRALADYGVLRLDPQLHKVDEQEFVSIIQHPGGDEKFIAIRENRVIKIGDPDNGQLAPWLWYASDTAPGSSGAPVLNDQWQVVAVHHRSVAESEQRDGQVYYRLVSGEWVGETEAAQLPDDRIRWLANEGIRTSVVLQKIATLHAAPGAQHSPFVQDLLDDAHGVRPFPGTIPRESIVTVSAPSLDVGEAAHEQRRRRTEPRKVRPFAYYEGRTGYDPAFLPVEVLLPTLTDRALGWGTPAPIVGTDDYVLRYTHFSVVMNSARRLAFYTAVNIDGARGVNLPRSRDVWFYDPRLPSELQVGNELYGNEGVRGGNWFDRGHLVRRRDPVWGEAEEAEQANDDTFHWTNCAPQYYAFNQGEDLWQGLEDFILFNTDAENVRASVFTGPLFSDDDEEHRGVLLPQYFWKVVAVCDQHNNLFTSAYVVSQQAYARNLPFERLPVGEYNNFQVAVPTLEARTGLDFGSVVREADVLPKNADDVPLRGLGDIKHPRRH